MSQNQQPMWAMMHPTQSSASVAYDDPETSWFSASERQQEILLNTKVLFDEVTGLFWRPGDADLPRAQRRARRLARKS